MRIEANRDVCVSAGMCVLNAPEVFDQDDDGVVELLSAEVPAEQVEAVTRAVQVCPSGALRLSG
ncbi:(4Fe-4S)-binding protein [Saccharopolyspora indica]|uniref:ferredoxin n=1 Tax=Saccharopolyspora indica TaxID=1229659 RepID=UPI0022EB0F69|nr:(4Fe-4S)-binding protein [Saccharopolyspora indica]MDA3642722.1 (4Fe-4S)-binding protein [Saccharopolyspora indica]